MVSMNGFLLILTWLVATHAEACGTNLELDRGGVATVWIGFLFTVAMFREIGHDCTAYDEEHSVMRATVVRS